MNKAKGLKPNKRKLGVKKPGKKLTANQWQNTPQQHLFMDNWITPKSSTFGNAYQSAINAGYGSKYAMQITAPTVLNQWISEYTRKLDFGPEHIKQGLQQLAVRAQDSKSPDDTRLKAYEILAKITGMIDNKNVNLTQVNVQPILGGESIKRVIDSK